MTPTNPWPLIRAIRRANDIDEARIREAMREKSASGMSRTGLAK